METSLAFMVWRVHTATVVILHAKTMRTRFVADQLLIQFICQTFRVMIKHFKVFLTQSNLLKTMTPSYVIKILTLVLRIYKTNSITFKTGDNPCLSNPCQNGASCVANITSLTYKCSCASGFTGANCGTGYFRK